MNPNKEVAMALNIFSNKKETIKEADEYKPTFFIDFTQKLVPLPPFSERTKINVRYPLLPPYAYAHIYWDDTQKELMYVIEEPVLTDVEKELLRLVQLGLEEMINISYVRAMKSRIVIQYLEKTVQSILIELGAKVSEDTYKKMMYFIYRDSIGLNEIEPLMNDVFIEDIECNGSDHFLYIVHRRYQNLRTNVLFRDNQHLTSFVEKLAQKTGRYISYAKPLLDGTLPDGSRVNATYTQDITTRGPTFTIRMFTKEPITPVNLIANGTTSAEVFAYLWLAVEFKLNIMIIGETASGKTTLLNSILTFLPPEARIISIEDTREINIYHENWLPAVTRTGFGMPNVLGQTYGDIDLFDLLRESFRQNPDYVVLGETRGKETYVLFQGMASGHPSYSTFHAASVETLVRRLSTPPIDLPPSLIESLDVVGIITHIKMADVNERKLTKVEEISRVNSDGHVEANTVFDWNPSKRVIEMSQVSLVFDKISARVGKSTDFLIQEVKIRAALLRRLVERNITNFKEISEIVNRYYKDQKSVIKDFDLSTEYISKSGVIVRQDVKTAPADAKKRLKKKKSR